MTDKKWEKVGRHFPKPNLDENKIYAAKDSKSGLEFEARFCFGEGEFWWLCPSSNREISVTHFVR